MQGIPALILRKPLLSAEERQKEEARANNGHRTTSIHWGAGLTHRLQSPLEIFGLQHLEAGSFQNFGYKVADVLISSEIR